MTYRSLGVSIDIIQPASIKTTIEDLRDHILGLVVRIEEAKRRTNNIYAEQQKDKLFRVYDALYYLKHGVYIYYP